VVLTVVVAVAAWCDGTAAAGSCLARRRADYAAGDRRVRHRWARHHLFVQKYCGPHRQPLGQGSQTEEVARETFRSGSVDKMREHLSGRCAPPFGHTINRGGATPPCPRSKWPQCT